MVFVFPHKKRRGLNLSNYLSEWVDIIQNCSYTNTYKMAWAKALVELASTDDYTISSTNSAELIISFDKISEKMLKYYWNQIIFFDLLQGPNFGKQPEISQYVKQLVSAYFHVRGNNIPKDFNRIEFSKLNLSSNLNKTIQNISKTLNKDVCWRFLKLGSKTYSHLYKIDRHQLLVIFNKVDLDILKQYSPLLFDAIHFKWVQMLEGFNHIPRISKKVRAIHDDSVKLRRSSLKRFHQYLRMEFPASKIQCFYCNQLIDESTTVESQKFSLDHVIPWLFMYSDDIWNLVFCHKGENSSKSSRKPDIATIKKLEQRNLALLKILEKSPLSHRKSVHELRLAIDRDSVRKYWISFKS